MSLDPALLRPLRKIMQPQLVYADCGARGGRLPSWLRPLKDTLYVGFEADPDECARLNADAGRGHRYVPAVLGGAAGERTFHVTRSRACASLLRPNAALLARFAGLPPLFEVERTVTVQTRTLDDCMDAFGLARPDFIELDTQGAELEILSGAGACLGESVLGLQVEVEFAAMYEDQPLFADIDRFLRERGFFLVDLARYRGRRAALPLEVPTRGQLLWGQALYLREHRDLAPARGARLGAIAALLTLPDLAAEAFQHVEAGPGPKELRHAASSANRALQTLAAGASTRGAGATWRD